MIFSNETKESILNRMLSETPSDIDKRQGSITNDLLSPAAIEIALAYMQLDNVLNFGFAETTYGSYLDLRVGELGVYRKEAVKSTGTVTFYGPDGTLIPAGTRISTDTTEPIYFVTTSEGIILNGSITVDAEAELPGALGNVGIGKVAIVLGDLSGVLTVSNTETFDGGTDIESDEDLLKRYIEKVQKPATSGNANHYLQWAKSIAGVGDAKVYPLWNGNGTVKVVLLDADKTAPPQSVVDEAADYIDSVRPIGATVTVVGATETPIDIEATLTLAEGTTLSTAQVEIESGLVAYLKTLAFTNSIVRYSQIANLILNANSVEDYADLTVNGGTSNITIDDGAVAVKGAVALT